MKRRHRIVFFVIAAVIPLSFCTAGSDEANDLLRHAERNVEIESSAEKDGRQKLILDIFRKYQAYLQQLTAYADDDGVSLTSAEKNATAAEPPVSAPSRNESGAKLQPAASLIGAHLDGYPALPDGGPVASILYPTPAQLAHKAEVDRQLRERKRFLMENPALRGQ